MPVTVELAEVEEVAEVEADPHVETHGAKEVRLM